VLPALIRKFHEAKVKDEEAVTLWGTGEPRREFLHADDLADACFYLMQHYDEPTLINVGVGEDLTIKELAQLISRVVGFKGRIVHDLSKPDGTPRKLLDVSKLASLGWKPKIGLEEGVKKVYQQFLESSQVVA
jgi:GDP-L-fucose synthase